MTKSCSYIYEIKNIKNGKLYIGSTKSLNKRWKEHHRKLEKNTHHSIYLQRAWNLYGKENFQFSVLELVEDMNFLLAREQFYLWRTNSCNKKFGYNISPTAGSNFGFKHSDETKELLSIITKGRKHSVQSKIKMSLAQKGRIISEETKQKMRGRKVSAETKMKLSISNTGKVRTEEAKRKTSESLKGKPRSPEVINKFKSKVVPQDVREKIAASLRGRKRPLETIQKMSASAKGIPWSQARRLAEFHRKQQNVSY